MYVRNPFDEQNALEIMRFVCRSWTGTSQNGMRLISERPSLKGTALDTVVVLNEPHDRLIGSIDPSLDELKLVVFPAYRSEFSGTESVELFELLMRSRSDIADWNRPCRAQLWVFIEGPEGVALVSPVRRWVLTDLDVLRAEADRLLEDGGTFRLRNFAGKIVVVAGGVGALRLEHESLGPISFPDWSTAMSILREFVHSDCWRNGDGPL